MIEKADLVVPVPYPVRDFSSLRRLEEIPDPLLLAHLGLYEGYVKNVNLLNQSLKKSEQGSPEWSEMKRRMGFELGGLRLHELYFENLAPGGSDLPRTLEDFLASTWGSFKHWKDEFEAVAQLRGVGWAILYQDPAGGRLSNHWINLHEEGHPPGFTPLLVMDVWEHAFAGMNRSSYIAAFFKNLRWDCVEARGAGALVERVLPGTRNLY